MNEFHLTLTEPQFAELTLRSLLKLPQSLTNLGDRTGGYMTELDMDTGHIINVSLVGRIDPKNQEKAERYIKLSIEKARRLWQRNRLSKDQLELTSYDSRNEKEEKYPGAFVCLTMRRIYSFSGLPALCDEAIMVMQSQKGNMKTFGAQIDILHSVVYAKRINEEGWELLTQLKNQFIKDYSLT